MQEPHLTHETQARKLPEGLIVTIRRGRRIRSSPVCEFLVFRLHCNFTTCDWFLLKMILQAKDNLMIAKIKVGLFTLPT